MHPANPVHRHIVLRRDDLWWLRNAPELLLEYSVPNPESMLLERLDGAPRALHHADDEAGNVALHASSAIMPPRTTKSQALPGP